MQAILIVTVCIIAVAVIFALQNAATVPVTFLFWSFSSSLALLLLGAFVLGIAAAILASLPSTIKRNRTIAGQRKALKEMENSVMEDQELLKPSKFVN